MIPITFGPADRQLFGVYHPAQTPSATAQQPRGVLLCNPWGQEAIRAHRLLRVLADRLARSGVHVLRFDYFGTGDSAGNDEDGELTGWAQDVLHAHQALQAQSPAVNITWLGVRLGALLVLQAATAISATGRLAAQVLLWDPVLDGSAYLALLATKHAENLQAVYSLPPFLCEQDPRQIAPGPIQEALGFGIGPTLHQQLEKVNPDSLWTEPPHTNIHIVANDEALSTQLKKYLSSHSDLSIQHLTHNFDWTAEEAMNTALVPANAIQSLVACVLQKV
jgi:uncharacterized protein